MSENETGRWVGWDYSNQENMNEYYIHVLLAIIVSSLYKFVLHGFLEFNIH